MEHQINNLTSSHSSFSERASESEKPSAERKDSPKQINSESVVVDLPQTVSVEPLVKKTKDALKTCLTMHEVAYSLIDCTILHHDRDYAHISHSNADAMRSNNFYREYHALLKKQRTTDILGNIYVCGFFLSRDYLYKKRTEHRSRLDCRALEECAAKNCLEELAEFAVQMDCERCELGPLEVSKVFSITKKLKVRMASRSYRTTKAICLTTGENSGAGYAGNSSPTVCLATIIGYPRFHRILPSLGHPSVYRGKDALRRRGILSIVYPVASEQNSDHLDDFWSEIIRGLAHCPKSPVIVAVTDLVSETELRVLGRTLFKYDFDSIHIAKRSKCQLAAFNATTGIVLVSNSNGIVLSTAVFEGISFRPYEFSADADGVIAGLKETTSVREIVERILVKVERSLWASLARVVVHNGKLTSPSDRFVSGIGGMDQIEHTIWTGVSTIANKTDTFLLPKEDFLNLGTAKMTQIFM